MWFSNYIENGMQKQFLQQTYIYDWSASMAGPSKCHNITNDYKQHESDL